MSIGDKFPDSFKEDFAKRNIRVGSVLKLFQTNTTPPKEKRFIIVGITEDSFSLATVYINTSINKNVNYSKELKSLQLGLEATCERPYLDHNSFVDCSQIYEKNYQQIFNAILKRPEAVIGSVSHLDLKEIKGKLLSSPKISLITKKKFKLFLD